MTVDRYRLVAIPILMAALISGCTSGNEVGSPQPVGSSTTTAPTSGTASGHATTQPTTSVSGGPLGSLEACSLLSPASLPASWGMLVADPNPILKLGDSDCDLADSTGDGVGISIIVYRGPGRGIDELSKTVAAPPTAIDIAGRASKIYRDTGGNTCGILFDFGPDQGLTVIASPPLKGSLDPCDIVTTAATAMAPNLPPS